MPNEPTDMSGPTDLTAAHFVTRDEHLRTISQLEAKVDSGNAQVMAKLDDMAAASAKAVRRQDEEITAVKTAQAGSGKVGMVMVIAIIGCVFTAVSVSTGLIAVVGSMALNPMRDDITEAHLERMEDNIRERGDAAKLATLTAGDNVLAVRLDGIEEDMNKIWLWNKGQLYANGRGDERDRWLKKIQDQARDSRRGMWDAIDALQEASPCDSNQP